MTDVFRFVTVRAPQRIADSLKWRDLLYYDEVQGTQPNFYKLLRDKFNELGIAGRLSTRPGKLPDRLLQEITSIAGTWYTQNRDQLDEEYYEIRVSVEKFYTQVLEFKSDPLFNVTRDVLLDAVVQLFQGDPPDTIITSQGFRSFRDLMWNMLYALFSGRFAGPAGDIDLTIICIRSMAMIEALANDDAFPLDQHHLERSLIALPVLPNDVFPLVIDSRISDDGEEDLEGDLHEDPPPAIPQIRPLGIADLRVVRQELARYEMGEITHIENVLRSEFRERKHRYLNRTEESFTRETEKETEEEKNLQSTDRMELQRESQKTINENFNLQAGVTVTYNGPVSVAANAGFSYNRAQSDSVREASNFAKEIINQTQKRINERIREERTRKTTEEIEEMNLHSFNNQEGPDDISGIYRWVNKIYRCQIYNYGKRLMFEIMLPEPAAYYKYAQENVPSEIQSPPPLPDGFTPNLIEGLYDEIVATDEITREEERFTVAQLVARYAVEGIEPAPAAVKTVGTTLTAKTDNEYGAQYIEIKDLSIPAGYRVRKISLHISTGKSLRGAVTAAWSVGHYSGLEGDSTTREEDEVVFPLEENITDWLVKRTGWLVQKEHINSHLGAQQIYRTVDITSEDPPIEEGIVPVTIVTFGAAQVAVGVEFTAERTEEKFQEWQLGVYNKIIQKYGILYSEYRDQKERAEIRRQTIQNPSEGANPLINKQLIEEELKKHCITMLTGWQYNGFDAMKYPENGAPRIDVEQAIQEGSLIRFFEQAFEWDKMTYLFYPYFWGRKSEWQKILQQDSADPLFKSFLRAGAAKVVLAVSKKFMDAILWYIKTGVLRIASDMPTVDDDVEHLSIVDEEHGQTDEIDGGTPEGLPWEVTIPTTLVILNSQGGQLESIE